MPQVKTIAEEVRGVGFQPKPTNSAKVAWKQLNWKRIEKVVFKLQKRIYQASVNGNVKLVRRLQKLLSNSYSAKCLSVRKVTQDNSGRKTAGVDGKKSLNYKERLSLIQDLGFSNKAQPLRRVWIPKPVTDEKRGLGIPTIRDRAVQMLAKLLMEPEWEGKFEPNSYGFRPGRSTHDAINAIFKQISQADKWILDADFAKCFDNINHAKLLARCEQFPSLQRQLKAWLKAGIMDGRERSETAKGTPQGGVISPLLANVALHGLEVAVEQHWKSKLRPNPKEPNYQNKPKTVRYADDLVVLHPDKNTVERLKDFISQWAMKEVGLEFKESKTSIVHIKEGVNFLGINLRNYEAGKRNEVSDRHRKLGIVPLLKPSKEKVNRHKKQISDTIKQFQNAPQAALIKALNPIIRGWCNYYSAISAKEAFTNCDHHVWNCLRSWIRKRSKGGFNKDKYFRKHLGNNWSFQTEEGLRLAKHSETPIKRHTKVQDVRSPFDGDWTYWGSRLSSYIGTSKKVQTLLKRQKGKCNHCGLSFTPTDLIEVDHDTAKKNGGSNKYENLRLLHKHCHDEKTVSDYAKVNSEGVDDNDP